MLGTPTLQEEMDAFGPDVVCAASKGGGGTNFKLGVRGFDLGLREGRGVGRLQS